MTLVLASTHIDFNVSEYTAHTSRPPRHVSSANSNIQPLGEEKRDRIVCPSPAVALPSIVSSRFLSIPPHVTPITFQNGPFVSGPHVNTADANTSTASDRDSRSDNHDSSKFNYTVSR